MPADLYVELLAAWLAATVTGNTKRLIVNLPLRHFNADSDEVARAFRDDVARYSDMMSPGVRCLAGA